MTPADSEYREFLPQECVLLKSAKKKIEDKGYSCGENCRQCPAIEILGIPTKRPYVAESTGNQFVDRNLGLRHTIVYSAARPAFHSHESSGDFEVFKSKVFQGLEVWLF